MNRCRDIWYLLESQPTMEASRVICTNCRIIVGPKTFKELISIILEVSSIMGMICRNECVTSGNFHSALITRHTDRSWFFIISLSMEIWILLLSCSQIALANIVLETACGQSPVTPYVPVTMEESLTIQLLVYYQVRWA